MFGEIIVRRVVLPLMFNLMIDWLIDWMVDDVDFCLRLINGLMSNKLNYKCKLGINWRMDVRFHSFIYKFVLIHWEISPMHWISSFLRSAWRIAPMKYVTRSQKERRDPCNLFKRKRNAYSIFNFRTRILIQRNNS